MNNLISIITPCYNSEDYIEQTIESVLLQTYTNWELLIIDDCSTDNSIKIINTYKDKRIKLIKSRKNGGAAIARNKGVEIANGRFITFLDSDDIWFDNFLDTTINFLIDNKKTVVFTSYERVDENLKPHLKPYIVPKKVDYNRLLFNCPLPMLTSMYDTKKIGKIKFPLVDKREDYALWLLILKKVDFAYGITTPLAMYRMRRDSYSRNKLEILKKTFNMFYNFLGMSLPRAIYHTLLWFIYSIKKYYI